MALNTRGNFNANGLARTPKIIQVHMPTIPYYNYQCKDIPEKSQSSYFMHTSNDVSYGN